MADVNPAAPAAVAPAAPADVPKAAPDAKPEGEAKPDVKALWRQAVGDKSIKHKGVEKKLADFDPDEAADYIRRGFGASEVVAETKKARAEADSILALQRAMAEGDDDAALEALVKFGGERGIKLLEAQRQRIAKEQDEYSQLTERERHFMQQQQQLQEQLRAAQAREREREEAEKTAQMKAIEAETRTQALQKASEVAKLIKDFPEAHVAALGPYVAKAWRESIDLGQELGRDVSPKALLARAQELFSASTRDFYAKLTPEEQFQFLGEESVRKLSALLVKRLQGAKTVPQQKPTPAAAERTESTSSNPQLGSPRYLMR